MKTSILTVIFSAVFLINYSHLSAQTNTTDTTVSFTVQGVCEQCKDRIEAAAKGKGVQSAIWNIDTKQLQLTYNPSRTTVTKISNRIAAAGHDTYLKKANDAVYNKLPDCCHYREPGNMHDNHSQDAHNDVATQDTVVVESPNTADHSHIRGVVLEEDSKGSFKPLMGATVAWLGTSQAAATDTTGVFVIQHTTENNRLIVSYAGYGSDTISVINMQDLKIVLASGKQLNEVKVTARRASTYINSYDPFRTAVMGKAELFKAACCNLSESFETNPSVDVSYNDAVTGSKQIQLLGLSGNYTQLTVENLPGPRGLATPLGLNSIPGTWVESIQLSKGTGSVVNGYESIAGQINVELKKPEQAEKLFANLYVNDFGKTDINLNLSQKIGKKWATGLLLHGDFFNNKKLDFNDDGFRDQPTGNLFSAVNRWSYNDNKGLMSQFGIKILNDEKTGGQVAYNPGKDKFTTNNYGLEINTKRVEGFGKIGYVFPEKKYKSIGLQLSAFDHQQDSYFGLTTYNGHQQNAYANLIYQSIINNTQHKFRTGLSFVYDKYNEDFNTSNYSRTEVVPGAFFEYTYSPSDKFDIVAGMRADHNSIFGWFGTPRLNVRYQPFTGTTIRASAGRGQRTANIFAENNSVFASSRQVHIMANNTSSKAYGLEPEVAWNKGISVDQKMRLFNRNALLSIDFFRNDFTNQVVVDLEDPRQVKFYNLDGKSFSNSLQAELSVEPIHDLNVRLAYRYFDVQTTYGDQLLQKSLSAKDRAFANIAYALNGWKFDYTVNYNGRKRIPSTTANPAIYQRASYSPDYVLMNTQVSKTLGKKSNIDIYIGAENLTNYFQKDAIIAADQPFSPYFDASLIWGPISGRMFYSGIRYSIK